MSDPLDPTLLFSALARNEARYVLTGSLAEALLGSPALALRWEICPSRDLDNLDRLAAALGDLGGEYEARPRDRVRNVTVATRAGDVEVVAPPIGADDYDGLVTRARLLDFGVGDIPVISLADAMLWREAARRTEDFVVLPILYALEDEIAAREDS